jgi:outer membrane protein OmpA-like peptidoglycan-associated protein
MVRKFLITTAITVVAIGGSTACATKKFVRTSVGEVNTKVDSLGRSVEETQERTRQNEGKIADVDQRAQAAAQAARQAADQANTAAGAAATTANTANTRSEALDKATRRLVFEVVISADQGNFKFGQTQLPDEARTKIDDMVKQLQQDPKNVFIEIEGHTDNVGDKLTNEKIGLERAAAVQRYLYEQYQIPLHKISVISYGEEKPAAPNQTRDGRAQNRRVVIKVLA